MGLEAATWINDLDSSNPLAGDKKNQGDDHLRLLKAVLKGQFPNATRAFRIPEVVSKSANYVVLDTDDNKSILCDTTAGAITLTLPAGLTTGGWRVKTIKTTADVNPVFVVPPSGTINGVAKIRCNIPYVENEFLWTGSVFVRLRAPGEVAPGSMELTASPFIPVGFGQANGQSLLRADYPELFATWGTQWGSVDGTHFNVPDARDRFFVGGGLSYALGGTGGEATHALTIAELAVHNHGITQNPHTHTVNSGVTGASAAANPPGGSNSPFGPGGVPTINAANADITINNTGSGAAHENRPPYLALYPIFRLC